MNAPVRRTLLGAGVALAAAAAGTWFGLRKRRSPGDETAAADPHVDTLFQQTLPDPSGTPVELADFRGRTVVFNFWATWCTPCIEEMPELSAMHTELAPAVQIIGIGVDSAENIRQFAEKLPVSYPLVVAEASAISWMRELGNTRNGLPFTVVVDPAGAVRTRVLGRFDEASLRSVIAAASATAA